MARIRGSKGDDILIGTPQNDILLGGNGDDTLEGREGDDVYVGGKGTDTAVFSDDIGNYSFNSIKKGILISHAADGNDEVRADVERLQFKDAIVEQKGDKGNYAPAAIDDNSETTENDIVDISILDNDVDVNSDTLTITAINGEPFIVGEPITEGLSGQVIVNNDMTVSYDPSGAFENLGVDQDAKETFTYTISDGHGGSAIGEVMVTVNGVNDDPAITLIALSVNENQTLAGTVTASDPDDSDTLIYSITGNGPDDDKFTIDFGTGSLSFISAPDFENSTASDPDEIYRVEVAVDDSNGGTTSRVIEVSVSDANDAPEIGTTSLDADENQTLAGDQ